MRVLVIDTGRGHSVDLVNSVRESLGLHPGDELCWLAWHPPREPLPVLTHLVLGPSLRNLGIARQCETAFHASEGDDIRRGELPSQSRQSPHDSAEEFLEEQLPESAQPHHRPVGEGSPDLTLESSDSASPQRLTGVAYLVKGTRNTARRTWRPLKARIKNSTRGPLPVARGLVQAVYPGVDDRFGLAAYRSRSVIRMAAECDVIVSHDIRSIPATWLIGQRVKRPELVNGVAAGRRVIAERRENPPGEVVSA